MDTRNKIATFCRAILVYYMASVLLAMPYFWWKEFKRTDSIIKAWYMSPIVAVFKSTHWPYYAFFPNKEDYAERLKRNMGEELYSNFIHLTMGVEHLRQASELGLKLGHSQDPEKDKGIWQSLMNKSLEELNRCDPVKLDELYPGWGTITEQKLKPGITYLLSYFNNGNEEDRSRGNALMEEYNAWIEKNRIPSAHRLHDKYGVNIRYD